VTIQFPNALDTFVNPHSNSHLNDAGVIHSVQHSDANDAIAALQRKIGTNGSIDPSSLDYKIRQLAIATGNAPVISTDSGNQIVMGTDGGLYVITSQQLASAQW
jgi:hypothetical protein